jgi:outer membrane receptor protein involved in Fe transport
VPRPRENGGELGTLEYNLFDRDYFDPVGFDISLPARYQMQQNGRNYRLKAVLRF